MVFQYGILFIIQSLLFIKINSQCVFTDPASGASVDFSTVPTLQYNTKTTGGNQYTMYFSLCQSFHPSCSSLGNLYACQIFSVEKYKIGLTYARSFTDYGIQLLYSAAVPGDCERKLIVTVYCDPAYTTPIFSQYNEGPACTYNAILYTAKACKSCNYLNNCNGHGQCNVKNGKCQCTDQATGDDCSQSRLSISSVTNTTISGGYVTIRGYFGTISNSIKVTIGGVTCNDILASSSRIICSIPPGEGSKDVIVYDNGLSSPPLVNGFTYQYYDCGNSCNEIHGTCDIYENVCICDDQSIGSKCSDSRLIIGDIIEPTILGGETIINGYFGTTTDSLKVLINGDACSIVSYSKVLITCLANPGQGVKNITVIDRDLSYSIPNGFTYQNLTCGQCSLIHGECNGYDGICYCDTQTEGDLCETSKLYVSSASITSAQGGLVFISGYFGNITPKFAVLIGTLKCQDIQLYNFTTISCNIGAGSGFKDITIMDYDLSFVGKDLFRYQSISNISCPNNCSGYGECNLNSGECTCFNDYVGYDCGSRNANQFKSIPKINTTNGESSISNQDMVFHLSIISLVEYSIDNSIIREYPLNIQSNIKSTILNSGNNSENKKILFSQFITDANCTVEYTIDEVVGKTDYEFAGVKFSVDPGSLKITVSINNYIFKNSLSTLQLRIKSNIQNENQDHDCNSKDTKINSDQLNGESNFNYITISKDSKNILSRFINRIISDNRITPIKTTIISTNQTEIILGINLNHCTKSCILDSTSSLFISNNFKEQCDESSSNQNNSSSSTSNQSSSSSNSSNRSSSNQSNSNSEILNRDNSSNHSDSTKIISISVVVPFVGLACIVAVGFFIYRRHINNTFKKKAVGDNISINDLPKNNID